VDNVYSASSLGYTSLLFAQHNDSTIHSFNVTFSAENTTISNDVVVIDGNGPVKGLLGTQIFVTETEASILAFFQTNGDDITVYVRNSAAGGVSTSLKLVLDKP